ncbi:DUF998 domain-containing protein [Pseudonocardia nigra]|uniref:DUF998 domain-containing protein n=1 Tax=Pseudonocardia nigra TaxID=1921578 RepID=UPI001C5D07A6|nr:DUF998 domain-containing protein [Pseudonocardia nigra]
METTHRLGRRWLGIGTLLLAVLALVAAARASIIMIYLGVAFVDEVNPVSVPLSYYVFVDGGEQLFVSAAVALAVGVLAVLLGMARAGVRLAGRPTVLFTVWALCLVLAAVFPTDGSPDIETFGGWMHQFAGAGILALLSFAGLAAAPRLAEHPSWRPVVDVVRALSIGAAVLAAAYVLGRVHEVVPGFLEFGGVDIGGILQRMVLAFDVAVVAALAVQLVRVSWPAVRARADRLTDGAAPQGP